MSGESTIYANENSSVGALPPIPGDDTSLGKIIASKNRYAVEVLWNDDNGFGVVGYTTDIRAARQRAGSESPVISIELVNGWLVLNRQNFKAIRFVGAV